MLCAMAPPSRALPMNLRGRDFFVGDIHGNYDGLREALSRCGFDPENDRLIAVGDLVDRRPQGHEALDWLRRPYFHSIRGNHEDLYLKWRSFKGDRAAQADYEERQYFRTPNGGAWVKEHGEDLHSALEEALQELPYFLSVPTRDGRVIGVVHAELPDGVGWPRIISRMEERDASLLETMTWGRERWKMLRTGKCMFDDLNQVFGLDAVVCGHVRVAQPVALGNIVYLDTGGWTDRGFFSVLNADEILAMVEAETGDCLPALA